MFKKSMAWILSLALLVGSIGTFAFFSLAEDEAAPTYAKVDFSTGTPVYTNATEAFNHTAEATQMADGKYAYWYPKQNNGFGFTVAKGLFAKEDAVTILVEYYLPKTTLVGENAPGDLTITAASDNTRLGIQYPYGSGEGDAYKVETHNEFSSTLRHVAAGGTIAAPADAWNVAIVNLNSADFSTDNTRVNFYQWDGGSEPDDGFFVRSVTVVKTSETRKAVNYAYADLDGEIPFYPTYKGISANLTMHNGEVGAGKPAAVYGEVEGKQAITIAGGYLFVSVDRGVVPTEATNVAVEIEYLDKGTRTMDLQYNSTDTSLGEPGQYFKGSDKITFTDTNTWKTGVIKLTDAAFNGKANGGDFRIPSSDQELTIASVKVGLYFDKTALETALADEVTDLTEYTEESAAAYTAALGTAKAVAADTFASEEAIANAATGLTDAKAALEKPDTRYTLTGAGWSADGNAHELLNSTIVEKEGYYAALIKHNHLLAVKDVNELLKGVSNVTFEMTYWLSTNEDYAGDRDKINPANRRLFIEYSGGKNDKSGEEMYNVAKLETGKWATLTKVVTDANMTHNWQGADFGVHFFDEGDEGIYIRSFKAYATDDPTKVVSIDFAAVSQEPDPDPEVKLVNTGDTVDPEKGLEIKQDKTFGFQFQEVLGLETGKQYDVKVTFNYMIPAEGGKAPDWWQVHAYGEDFLTANGGSAEKPQYTGGGMFAPTDGFQQAGFEIKNTWFNENAEKDTWVTGSITLPKMNIADLTAEGIDQGKLYDVEFHIVGGGETDPSLFWLKGVKFEANGKSAAWGEVPDEGDKPDPDPVVKLGQPNAMNGENTTMGTYEEVPAIVMDGNNAWFCYSDAYLISKAFGITEETELDVTVKMAYYWDGVPETATYTAKNRAVTNLDGASMTADGFKSGKWYDHTFTFEKAKLGETAENNKDEFFFASNAEGGKVYVRGIEVTAVINGETKTARWGTMADVSDKEEEKPPVVIEGKPIIVIDKMDNDANYNGSLDKTNKKQGIGAVTNSGTKGAEVSVNGNNGSLNVELPENWASEYYVEAWIYVSKASAIGNGSCFELSQVVDNIEVQYDILGMNLQDGWNKVQIKISDMNQTAIADMKTINQIRFFCLNLSDDLTIALDDIVLTPYAGAANTSDYGKQEAGKLTKAIADAEKADTSKWTADQKATLKAAIDAAKAINGDEATVRDVQVAAEALADALKVTPPTDPTKPDPTKPDPTETDPEPTETDPEPTETDPDPTETDPEKPIETKPEPTDDPEETDPSEEETEPSNEEPGETAAPTTEALPGETETGEASAVLPVALLAVAAAAVSAVVLKKKEQK